MAFTWGNLVTNAEVRWESFDPVVYVNHNYRVVRADDEKMLHLVRDHFGACFRERADGPVSGVDVGAGPNLYPALAMLPWCDEITLLDRSPANVGYLDSQVASYDTNWDRFWQVLREHEAYGSLGASPRERFARVVKAEQGDVFGLGRHEGRWSVGTMFFVAESITASDQEFALGVEHFMRALAPGAPFAAAFMAHSLGLDVGGVRFPACPVGEGEVREALAPFADDFSVQVIAEPYDRLREGCTGMLLALGRRRGPEG